MGFDIAPPRAEHLLLAKYIIIVLSLLFVSYISILFGATILSLGFSFRGKSENNETFNRFSRDLVDTLMGSWGVVTAMVILPVLTIAISFGQVLYGTDMKVAQYFTIVFVLTMLAIVFAYAYKKSFATRDENFNMHLALGGIAVLLFHAAIFAFVSTVTFALYPENWKIITSALPLTYEWSMFARFAHFMTLSLAITGGAILFFFFNWDGGKANVDGAYGDYVRKFSGGLTLGMTVLQTLFMVWFLATLPQPAKSYDVYITGILAMGVLWLICYFAFSLLHDSKVSLGKIIFPLLMVFLLFVLVDEHFARENSLAYQNYKLTKMSEKFLSEVEQLRAERSGSATPSLAVGEEIFTSKCSICHQFDIRVVGPAYNDVMAKYENDLEALKTFILNPQPVNPNDYPGGMPNQGLKPHEAESAAMYLMEEFQKQQNAQ